MMSNSKEVLWIMTPPVLAYNLDGRDIVLAKVIVC
jgi:hypothetical protein